jgi:hypothetical protein
MEKIYTGERIWVSIERQEVVFVSSIGVAVES